MERPQFYGKYREVVTDALDPLGVVILNRRWIENVDPHTVTLKKIIIDMRCQMLKNCLSY